MLLQFRDSLIGSSVCYGCVQKVSKECCTVDDELTAFREVGETGEGRTDMVNRS